VLQESSARNRNNTRTELSSLFQVFVDNDFIEKNFIKDISVLKTTPTRNKTYTEQQQQQLYNKMQQEDPTLLLFVKFVSYNFLRPIEVCRLRVSDVDLVEKKLYVRAKNQPVKTKIIPEILLKDLPDLSQFNNDFYLFTPEGIGGIWDIEEANKRTYFTGRFKKIKDQLGYGKEYGLYSFRHTFITKLYREIAKDSTPFATKSKLMLITGHSSMIALEKYLRDIDAELPKDYSDYLR
jgi:integrase